MSTGVPRPVVLYSFRHTVFNSRHSLSHPSVWATQCLVTARYVWPGINADVCTRAHACLQCQRSKVQQYTVTPPSTIATLMHVSTTSKLALLVLHPTDPPIHSHLQFARWPEAIPINNITAETAAQAFITGRIVSFRVLSTIITDCGCQSALWQQLMQLLGFKHIQTTSYHPSASGLVERLHCQLIAATPNKLDCPWPSLASALHGKLTFAALRWSWCTGPPCVYPVNSSIIPKEDTTAAPVIYVARLRSSMQQLQAAPA